MGHDVVGQNFVGQDVTGAISLGQNVVGQDVSGAGRRGAELRGAGRRWGKISGAGGHGAEGSGAGSGSPYLDTPKQALSANSCTTYSYEATYTLKRSGAENLTKTIFWSPAPDLSG